MNGAHWTSRDSVRIASIVPLAVVSIAALAATPRPASRTAARTSQTIGHFKIAGNEFRYHGTPNGFVMTLSGHAVLEGEDRTITADRISAEMPKQARDIKGATAAGGVKIHVNNSGRMLNGSGQSLAYDRVGDTMNLYGGVHIVSDLDNGGSVDATGDRAVVKGVMARGTATLTGGVSMTLVKPDVLSGPGHFSGSVLTVDLKTGDWQLNGGDSGAHGNLTLKPKAASETH